MKEKKPISDIDSDKKTQFVFVDIIPIFFIPAALKKFDLKKSNFKETQHSLGNNMSFTSFVGSITSFIVGIIVYFLMIGFWDLTKTTVYTYLAFISITGICLLSSLMLGFSIFYRKKDLIKLRFAGDVLFHLAIALTSIFFFLADLTNGDLSATDSISAAIIFIVILILCQPGNWIYSITFHFSFAITYIVLFIYGFNVYGMTCLDQYILIIVLYLVASYFSFSAYSYIEIQRYYIQFRNSELLYKSTHDNLTDIRNRNGLRLYIDDHLSRWKTQNIDVLAIMVDIDEFKLYNDEYGHINGDRVLKRIATALSGLPVAQHIHVFRYGGEEFLIVSHSVSEADVRLIMDEISKSISGLNIKAPRGAPEKYLTVSIGASIWKADENYIFRNHIEDADEAMYEAKKTGKNKGVLRVRKGC